MIRFKDILILLLELTVFFLLGVYILAGTDYPFLVLPLFLIYIVVHYSVKRQKRILPYVIDDFKKLGFELIKEDPIPLFDSEASIKPAIIVNNLPISRYGYIRQFARLFKAKTRDGQFIELTVLITKKWNGKNEIEIKKKNVC